MPLDEDRPAFETCEATSLSEGLHKQKQSLHLGKMCSKAIKSEAAGHSCGRNLVLMKSPEFRLERRVCRLRREFANFPLNSSPKDHDNEEGVPVAWFLPQPRN